MRVSVCRGWRRARTGSKAIERPIARILSSLRNVESCHIRSAPNPATIPKIQKWRFGESGSNARKKRARMMVNIAIQMEALSPQGPTRRSWSPRRPRTAAAMRIANANLLRLIMIDNPSVNIVDDFFKGVQMLGECAFPFGRCGVGCRGFPPLEFLLHADVMIPLERPDMSGKVAVGQIEHLFEGAEFGLVVHHQDRLEREPDAVLKNLVDIFENG